MCVCVKRAAHSQRKSLRLSVKENNELRRSGKNYLKFLIFFFEILNLHFVHKKCAVGHVAMCEGLSHAGSE